METLRAATTNGTVTLNPISGILTRPDTYQTEGGEWEGGGGGGLDNKAGKMPYLTVQQASKCDANHGAPLAENTKVAPEP